MASNPQTHQRAIQALKRTGITSIITALTLATDLVKEYNWRERGASQQMQSYCQCRPAGQEVLVPNSCWHRTLRAMEPPVNNSHNEYHHHFLKPGGPCFHSSSPLPKYQHLVSTQGCWLTASQATLWEGEKSGSATI